MSVDAASTFVQVVLDLVSVSFNLELGKWEGAMAEQETAS